MIDLIDAGVPADGITDAAPAIQTLYDSGAREFFAPTGAYALGSMLSLPANALIWNSPGAHYIRKHQASMIANGYSQMPDTPVYTGRGNLRIIDGIYDGNGVEIQSKGCGLVIGHGKNIKVRDVEFRNIAGNHAVECNAAKDVVFQGCRFRGFRKHSTNTTPIEAIQFDVATQVGFGTWGPFDGTPCTGARVIDCDFEASDELPAWYVGVGSHGNEILNRHTNIELRGNTFRAMLDSAIQAWSWSDFLMTGNKIYSPEKCGIEVLETYFATLIGNRVFDAGESGIRFSNNGTVDMRDCLLIGSGRKQDNTYRALELLNTDNANVTACRVRMRSTGNGASNGFFADSACSNLRWGANDFNQSGKSSPSVVNQCTTTTLMGANAL